MGGSSVGARLEAWHGEERLQGSIVRATPRGLTVRMVEPWPGLESGFNVMVLAIPYARFIDEGRLTDRGWRRARELLIQIQGAACAFAAAEPRLRAYCQEQLAAGAIDPEALDDAGFRSERAALRRQLRHEGLPQTTYQHELGILRHRNAAYHEQHIALLEAIRGLVPQGAECLYGELVEQLAVGWELPLPDCPSCFPSLDPRTGRDRPGPFRR